MDLSIIIPVYNGEQLLARCLDSVCGQTTRYSFEVILIDDGSTDGSVRLIEERKESCLTLLRQQNAGPAVARNRGLEAAQGRYCTYLDADDYWNDGYVERTVDFLDRHRECVAVTVGQDIRNTEGHSLMPQAWIEEGGEKVIDDFFEAWAATQFVGTCSTTMRTDTVRRIGGQRLDLRVMEDWNFWFRLATQGRWGFVADVLYVSDGTRATPSDEKWVAKMKARWHYTPTVEEWQKDILTTFPEGDIPAGYAKARAFIVRTMAYGHLLDGRFALARQEVRDCGADFPRDPIGRLMLWCKGSGWLWEALCRMLRWREHHRFSRSMKAAKAVSTALKTIGGGYNNLAQRPLEEREGRIAFILPYFGHFDSLWPLWLQTCAKNAEMADFLIYTDDETDYDWPENVFVCRMSFDELRQRVAALYDFPVSLERPYRLCCFKPAYGEIFKDDLTGYSHWAFGDCDLLWGSWKEMLPTDWRDYDRIGAFGHLSLIRNTEHMRTIYRYGGAYRTAFTIDAPLFFDEDAYNLILERNGCKTCALKIADLWPRLKNLHVVSLYEQGNRAPSVFVWREGRLTGYRQEGGKMIEEEYAYVHFLKRPMKIKAKADGSALLVAPNEITHYHGEAPADIIAATCGRGLFWPYWRNSFRWHNFKERLLNRLYRNRKWRGMMEEMKGKVLLGR